MTPGNREAVRTIVVASIGLALLVLGFAAGWTLRDGLDQAAPPLRALPALFPPLPPDSCHYRAAGALPDPSCTPGALNPAVTPATLQQTICRRGWTATVRPSSYVTGREKIGSMQSYSAAGSGREYEYDHLISLELGGAPNDVRNLWPEPHQVGTTYGGPDYGSFAKDKVENALKRAICSGKLSLQRAQAIASGNWTLGFPYARIATPALP